MFANMAFRTNIVTVRISLSKVDTSGPAISHLLSAASRSCDSIPMAPKTPFITALFCLWTWSIAIEENGFPVLFMTKFPWTCIF